MNAAQLLVEALGPQGYWCGRLSSSALSTATAVCALHLYRQTAPALGRQESSSLDQAVADGAQWLARTQCEDGGWGDTPGSPSNISTTLLCWASLTLLEASEADGRPEASDSAARPGEPAPPPGRKARRKALAACRDKLMGEAGGLDAEAISQVILRRYGGDRTFSVPILTHCAIAGCFGAGPQAWQRIPALPFELAALPHGLYQFLGLPMVSYAMPALIAIGQVRHHHRPGRHPLTRLMRGLARGRTLDILTRIQPGNGGFLEATPLTSFVSMSLISMGLHDHTVVRRALDFLKRSQRRDGSWPIDTNLATWVSTLSVNALAAGGRLAQHLSPQQLRTLAEHLLKQQYRQVHPFTRAAPGGWAWTHLPGGVPDADDTAGALLALRRLREAGAVDASAALESARAGVRWLLDLQNRDGGIPTFCRGWGRLPFDRSSPDLTAHALRALEAWKDDFPDDQARLQTAMQRAAAFLLADQTEQGTWIPLWFGNQQEEGRENPVYGTSRVLLTARLKWDESRLQSRWTQAMQRAVRWLAAAQGPNGGWGAAPGVPSSLEETAIAVEALAAVALTSPLASRTCPQGEPSARGNGESNATPRPSEGPRRADGGLTHSPDAARPDRASAEQPGPGPEQLEAAVASGLNYLDEHLEDSAPPTPIGLYFAQLWYSEDLYPLIFSAAAQEASR